MFNATAISYSLGAALFLVLTVLLVTAWRGRLQGGLLVAAAALSCVWCGLVAGYGAWGWPPLRALAVFEVARDGAWFAFLLGLLGVARGESGATSRTFKGAASGAALLCVAVAALVGLPLPAAIGLSPGAKETLTLFGFVLLAVAGLALVEQLFRNTRPEHRWGIKYLCLGVGGLFAFDFFLYSNALLFTRVDAELWAARGAVNALVVPLIAVAAARNPDWSLEVFVSRHVVFHTAALVGAGAYLLLMAAAGYYIRLYGGTWGRVAEIVFLFGAVVVLFALVSSGQLRSKGKVFLSKHFFKNKYDYREEWLRFTHTLSSSREGAELRENIVRAIADIVESPGGVMWVRRDSGHFYPAAQVGTPAPAAATVPPESPLCRFLERSGWVIFLDEHARDPGHYGGLELPPWLGELRRASIIVPLQQGDELLGFVALLRSQTKTHLNWEDSDMLKTVGRQAASYLAMQEANEALASSRQFDAFNRLSSYVVHDLKNLVAQLSLVTTNARRHMENPAFVADAFATVENATAKMNRLLASLRKGRLEETTTRLVNVKPILEKVVSACAARPPVPRLRCLANGAIVRADPERVATVLEHLVQNAQEATPEEGRVEVRLDRDDEWVTIEIEDTGCGMDERFVSERLFRPFDTTKGNAGMGIGAYESREFVLAHGGELDVFSRPGEGTMFRIRFPIEAEAGQAASPELRAEVSS